MVLSVKVPYPTVHRTPLSRTRNQELEEDDEFQALKSPILSNVCLQWLSKPQANLELSTLHFCSPQTLPAKPQIQLYTGIMILIPLIDHHNQLEFGMEIEYYLSFHSPNSQSVGVRLLDTDGVASSMVSLRRFCSIRLDNLRRWRHEARRLSPARSPHMLHCRCPANRR